MWKEVTQLQTTGISQLICGKETSKNKGVEVREFFLYFFTLKNTFSK